MIKENSYWYTDLSLPEDDQKLMACCEKCHKSEKIKAWFWEGSKYGYAYEMNCSICNKILSSFQEQDVFDSSTF